MMATNIGPAAWAKKDSTVSMSDVTMLVRSPLRRLYM